MVNYFHSSGGVTVSVKITSGSLIVLCEFVIAAYLPNRFGWLPGVKFMECKCIYCDMTFIDFHEI